MGNSRAVSFQLDEAQTGALLRHTHQAYHTEIDDVLLTALGRALHAAFGGQAYAVTLEGHGREDILDFNISRTVGWYTSTFPFVLEHENAPGRRLQRVKEALRRIPNKGIGFGLLRYLGGMQTLEDPSAIKFNYLGDFGQSEVDKNGFVPLFQLLSGASVSPRAQRGHELGCLGVDRRRKIAPVHPLR